MMTLGKEDDYFPYLIVLVTSLCVLILLFIRRYLVHREVEPNISIGNGQIIGQRDNQDDYFATSTTEGGTIAVVADGISGLSHGRMASTVAVRAFIREFLKADSWHDIPSFFRKASRISNTEILDNLAGEMGGTTLVVAVITDGFLYWGSVGDSLITVYRDGEFITFNRKHTLESVLEERYLSGEISKDELLDNPMRNRLVNYLGYEAFQTIEVGREPFPLRRGDKVILCSDGVYNTLSEMEMEAILNRHPSAHEAAEEMIEAVERKRVRNQDNATIVIMQPGW